MSYLTQHECSYLNSSMHPSYTDNNVFYLSVWAVFGLLNACQCCNSAMNARLDPSRHLGCGGSPAVYHLLATVSLFSLLALIEFNIPQNIQVTTG